MSDLISFCWTVSADTGHRLAGLLALVAALGLVSCGKSSRNTLGSDGQASNLDVVSVKKVDAIVGKLTLDDKISLVTGAAKASTDPVLSAGFTAAIDHDGVDIPALYLGDSPNGVG